MRARRSNSTGSRDNRRQQRELEKGIDGEVKPSEGWRGFAEAPGVDSNGGVRDGGMGGGGISRESNTSDEQRETMM